MIALQITDLRSFTKHLFTQNTFDGFWLSEAAVQTSAALIIECKTDPAFFSEKEAAEEELPKEEAAEAGEDALEPEEE